MGLGQRHSSGIRIWPPLVWPASVRHTRGGTLTKMSGSCARRITGWSVVTWPSVQIVLAAENAAPDAVRQLVPEAGDPEPGVALAQQNGPVFKTRNVDVLKRAAYGVDTPEPEAASLTHPPAEWVGRSSLSERELVISCEAGGRGLASPPTRGVACSALHLLQRPFFIPVLRRWLAAIPPAPAKVTISSRLNILQTGLDGLFPGVFAL